MKLPFKPIQLDDADKFSVEEIHNLYWDDFCKVCFSRLGLRNSANIDSKKFLKMYISAKIFRATKKNRNISISIGGQQFIWKDVLTPKVNGKDLERFREAFDFFKKLDTKDHAVFPMLVVLLRMQQSISKGINEDINMLDYLWPRKSEFDFDTFENGQIKEKYYSADSNKIDELPDLEKKLLELLKKEKCWNEQCQGLLENLDVNGESHRIWLVQNVCEKLTEDIICKYNKSINDIVDIYLKNISYRLGDAKHAIVYRIFMSYLNSFSEIDSIFKDTDCINLSLLKETRLSLIEKFKNHKLGLIWYDFINSHNGFEVFAKYFINQRETFTSKDEEHFFYLLDEICIITDILVGKAGKYWDDAEYIDNAGDSKLTNEVSSYPNSSSKRTSFSSAIKIPQKEEMIIRRIHQYIGKETKPKDVVMPIRAAMEAGVIRRPTWSEFNAEFGKNGVTSKSSFSEYTKPETLKYDEKAFFIMVEEFKKLI